ncbi:MULTISPECIES: PTS system mannose/fructose/N-acetylgalactosamine-transporter subunit IIB [Anaerostipes]|uniref:PTS sorbose transporter subunit IIB n=2 Tax=Anaerostipes TaxID=207244 RepID=A0A916Q824_9FIRM|nr:MULTISPECIES: PTS sugar transporter subunit IIB [Anaerostipes]GFO85922.1 PTS sorbose transporter subunit IIB [Anaerostipes butyraticus]HJC49549.1 PTS sugar transporter subunit IIB [Candidatus Anaerostipes avistercoris]HJC82098.1 PTS sugar transporter subunit IIB [Candidatus Anaerostipes avicola]
MGTINLVRIDDRLIHGQVMTKWSKGMGTNAIYVIDDVTAADDFMKDIYISTNSSANLKIEVYSVDEAVEEYKKNQYGDDKVILLFKTVAYAKKFIEAGIPVDSLCVGGIAKKPKATFVISTVGLTQEDAQQLKELHDKGIEVYFQIVPDTPKVSFEDAMKKM